MRIVISDVNRIWIPDHPALEPFADLVLVVCLNGEKVTDKYQCIVSPYKSTGLGSIPFGLDSAKLKALRSIEDLLTEELEYREDVVFLTDMEAEGLYPFIVIKDKNLSCALHLFSITPWKFEALSRKKAVNSMLTDLSTLNSVLFLDSEYFLWKAKKTDTLPQLIHDTQVWCGDLLPDILYQIRERTWDRAFFDTKTMKYVPLDEGESFEDSAVQMTDISNFDSPRYDKLMGVVLEPEYPSRSRDTFDEVEALVPRIDGKEICDYLRKLRIIIAEANHIPFESEECPHKGPCAGTCRKCDMESEYLRQEMLKIAPEKRVFPYDELTSWEVF